MESGFGVRFNTPGRIELVISNQSTTNMLPTEPSQFGLASTGFSVEKSSTPEPGLPPADVPTPTAPGASVTSEIMLRPASGNSDKVLVSNVIWLRVSAVLPIG